MYNILIVDDEELICRGLKSMIERSGIEDAVEIYYTIEPELAFDLVLEKDINVIITDIRMPRISGLDLIRDLSQRRGDIKFVVLSGFDDFNYVKEAFKLGAMDYLLKPGSIEELRSVLNRVIGAIKEDEYRRQSHESETRQYREAVLENKLSRFFSGIEASGSGMEAFFKKLGIEFHHPLFCTGIIALRKGTREGTSFEEISPLMNNSIRDKNTFDNLNMVYFYDVNNNLVILFNYSASINLGSVAGYMDSLIQNIYKSMNFQCFASISEGSDNIEELPKCYNQAVEALAYRAIYDPGCVISYLDIINKDPVEDKLKRELSKLKELILRYRSAEISNLIDYIFDRQNLKNTSIKGISKLYRKALNYINEVINDNELIISNETFQDFGSFDNLSELKIYLKTIIFEVNKLLKEKNTNKSVSDIVKKYVKENYHRDIDMAVVSNLVSLSYTHFSKLFKDETGMNFSDYLLKVRMEKALELLGDPANKVYDIAQSIGYGNPKHFTRAFGNYFGFSPSDYRNSKRDPQGGVK